MLKRLLFMFGIAATSTVAADAQARTNRTGATAGGTAAALSGAQLTQQAQIADLQTQVAILKKQVAQLTTHTHAYYPSPPESNARFSIDDVKDYILHNQGRYGSYLVLVRDPSMNFGAPPASQTGRPVLQPG
jgi:hypothetical protein